MTWDQLAGVALACALLLVAEVLHERKRRSGPQPYCCPLHTPRSKR